MTLEEILKGLGEDKTLIKGVLAFVNGTEQGKEVLSNFAKIEVDKAIAEKTAEIYTGIDNDLFEVLGKRKSNDQKTYDFVKGLATELKELKDKGGKGNETRVKELEKEIKELQASGSVNEHWKKIHDESVSKWDAERNDYESKIKNSQETILRDKVMFDLEKGLKGLSFIEALPKEAVESMIQVQREKLMKGAKFVDGKVIYHDAEGKPIMNKEYKPSSSNEIWGTELNSIIKPIEQQAQGGKAPKTSSFGSLVKTGKGDTAEVKLVLDKSKFGTKVEFNTLAEKTLLSQGLTRGSKEFNQAIDGAYKEYEVDNLELR